MSLGQISLSPQNGLTVMVYSSKEGKLSLYPPSIYRTPWNFGGISPEKKGIKEEQMSAWMRSCLVGKSDTMTFLPSQTRVNEMWSLPLTLKCASSGRIFNKPSSKMVCISKVGWNGPSDFFRASVISFNTLLVMSPAKSTC